MNQPQLTKYADSADSGTRIHNWLAGNHGETLNAEELAIAKSLEAGRNKLVSEWEEEFQARVMAEGNPGDEGSSTEDRWFLHAGITPVTSGKWDYLARRGNHFLLLDYKTGWQELPPVRHNLQMRVYALLVYQKHPEAESISVAIVRPGDEDNEKAFFFTYARTDLESAWIWWQNVLNGVFSANPPIFSGEHCQFCKAQYTCYARQSALAAFTVKESAKYIWADISPDMKAAWFLAWKDAERMGKSITERVREDLESGIAIPGLRIGRGKMDREIDEAQTAYARATAAGMSHKDFMSCVKVSFAQLRDAMCKIGGWKKKDANDKALALLGGIVTEKISKGSIEY